MQIIADDAGLHALGATLARASRIAVDVESNGMHAYRARVCTVQLAWEAQGGVACAVVDALAVDVAALAPLLDHRGPEKVLHDLGFDARVLSDAGVHLGRASDTEVMARLLGRPRTGLASLLAERGEAVSKALQQHDWARRPLTPPQLEYLAGDVRHLFDLLDQLREEVARAGIEPEVEEETQHKLRGALRPEPPRPPHARVKGLAAEDDVTRSVMHELLAERERVAARLDLPPYKVANTEALLLAARSRPRDAARLSSVSGMQRAARSPGGWLAAISRGVARGAPPEEPPPPQPSQAERASRSRREAALRAFRRAESQRRGVEEQVVLPGHCVEALSARAPETIEQLRAVDGLGSLRVARYGERLLGLLSAG
ncbi:MAG: HRDC domain-containing protein [Polyangiaceae bacterium]|nr:HRDC domain-containing protein [Polyangiaceae bacterium]